MWDKNKPYYLGLKTDGYHMFEAQNCNFFDKIDPSKSTPTQFSKKLPFELLDPQVDTLRVILRVIIRGSII